MTTTIKRIATATAIAATILTITAGCKDIETTDGTTGTTSKPVIDLTREYNRLDERADAMSENSDLYDGLTREEAKYREKLHLDEIAESAEERGYEVIKPEDRPLFDLNGDGK